MRSSQLQNENVEYVQFKYKTPKLIIEKNMVGHHYWWQGSTPTCIAQKQHFTYTDHRLTRSRTGACLLMTFLCMQIYEQSWHYHKMYVNGEQLKRSIWQLCHIHWNSIALEFHFTIVWQWTGWCNILPYTIEMIGLLVCINIGSDALFPVGNFHWHNQVNKNNSKSVDRKQNS